MKLIEKIKKELNKMSPSYFKNIINIGVLKEEEVEKSSSENDILIFEEGRGSFSFELEDTEGKREVIDDIVRLLKMGQYDQAIEKIRELKGQSGLEL
jgi:hypothetical protein